MRANSYAILVAAAIIGSAVPAWAAVTISAAATQNMTCTDGTCTPTAADAVLNVSELQSLLASGNVAVSTTGAGMQANDIRIVARLAWSSRNVLALDAYRSIVVASPVTVRGAGGVSLITNEGGRKGQFSCENNGRLTFTHNTSALQINGANYVLVDTVSVLASAIAANPSGAFALARRYNASVDGTYASPPIATVFEGSFNGLGNTISNLTINDPTSNAYVGLFGEITGGATLANVRLQNENVTGASGTEGDSSTEYVGGLVGFGDGASIVNSFVSGSVTGGTYAPAGGLAGVMTGTVDASASSAAVAGSTHSPAGGLIGLTNKATVARSYATGIVSGGDFVGGLVGFQGGVVGQSYATGNVTAIDNSTYAGGLVGVNYTGSISKSFATGAVTCMLACGGLAGTQGFGLTVPAIRESFASGSVSGNSGAAGGLIGFNQIGTISDSYAVGEVSAQTAGGLAGYNVGGQNYSIARSYSSGMVNGSSGSAGGLIGYDDSASPMSLNYWDTTTSSITNKSQGAGNVPDDPGIKGLTNRKLQSGLPKGFGARVWNENPNINSGLPYLISNPPPN